MWYYAKNNEQFGPVEEAAVRHLVEQGVVTAETLVWKPGMPNWAPAGSVGLTAAAAAAQNSPPSPPPPPAPPMPPPPPSAAGATASSETRTLALLAHVLGLLTSFLGPLILLAASQNEEVKAHARRALNWQLSLIIYTIVSIVLVFVLIGILLIVALMICDFIFCIIAAVKAADGRRWNYPMAIPFLRD